MRSALILLSVLLVSGCDDPTGPNYSMTGEWGIEGAAADCGFYEAVTITGDRAAFTGSGETHSLTGNRSSITLGPYTLRIEGESDRGNHLQGSFDCEGADGLWSMVKYAS